MKGRRADFVFWGSAVIGILTLLIAIPRVIHVRRTISLCANKLASDTSESKLIAVYREVNEDYFLGTLPVKNTTVQLGDLSEHNWLGHIEQRQGGTWLIVIDTKGHPTERQAEMTLIHEMCHQYRFILNKPGIDDNEIQSCMKDVANQDGFRDRW